MAVLAVASLVGGVLVAEGGSVSAAPAKWSVAPSPHGGALSGVSCASVRHCVAVGSFLAGPPPDGPTNRSLITANPNEGRAAGKLYGASCPRVTFCVAVGNANTPRYGQSAGSIIMTWDGTRWSLTPSPDLSAFGMTAALYGVSCVSTTSCVLSYLLALGGH